MRLVLSPESSQGVVGLLDELKLHKTFDFLQQEIGIGEQGRNLVGEVVRNAAEDIGYKIVCESEKLAMQVQDPSNGFESFLFRAALLMYTSCVVQSSSLP